MDSIVGAPVAAIDCGTNSIKLLVLDGDGRILARESRMVRLGQGVDTSGELAPEALVRTFTAIDEYAGILHDLGVSSGNTRFCATSATRDSRNADVFIAGVQERLGVAPEVLSGPAEAALVYLGATRLLPDDTPEPVLVVDIGGGSTELVLGAGGEAEQAVSLDIGSVRLHERHLHDDPPTAAQIAACVGDARAQLEACPVDLPRSATVIGTAGTIKTLAAGLLDLPEYDRDAIDGSRVSVAQTRDFADRLVAMTVAERRELPWMHPGRADVIDAGALIWAEVLAHAGVEDYLVSEADILYGIAWSMT